MANTANRGYPMPVDTKSVKEEIENLQQNVLPMLDNDVQALFDAIANLAPLVHSHAIADITGLTTALAGKMPASTTFALSDLTDVVGSAEAPDGYVLAKVGAEYVAQAALAALGPHGHTIAQVSGLSAALDAKADDAVVVSDMAALETAQAALEAAQVNAVLKNGQVLSDAEGVAVRTTIKQGWEQIGPAIVLGADAASIDWTGLSAFRYLRISGRLAPATSNQNLQMRLGTGGVFETATEYNSQAAYSTGASVASSSQPNATYFYLTIGGAGNNMSARGATIDTIISDLNQSRSPMFDGTFATILSAGTIYSGQVGGVLGIASVYDCVRILAASGNLLTGSAVVLEGIRG